MSPSFLLESARPPGSFAVAAQAPSRFRKLCRRSLLYDIPAEFSLKS
jgi:hypothetical protein